MAAARRTRARGAAALALGLAAVRLAAFVPPASLGRRASSWCAGPSGSVGPGHLTAAAAGKDEQYQPYDWQRVAETKGPTVGETAAAPAREMDLDLDDLPDLPDMSGEDSVASLGAKVKVREMSLPDLPGDPDILPPEPNPILAGLGLFEWTGIWIGGLVFIAALGYAVSFGLARAQMDSEFADAALSACKILFGLSEVLFLGRVLLTQFPNIKTTDMPWAFVHYPTEWLLAPTRMVFKPEAGVDIAPLLWLMLVLLAGELLTGPAGVLTLLRDGSRLPPMLSS